METINTRAALDLNKPDRPPLCNECNYSSSAHSRETETYVCFHPENYAGVSLVDGSVIFISKFCAHHRSVEHERLCGISGKWFKEKEKIPAVSVQNYESFSPEAVTNIRDIAKKRLEQLKNKKVSDKDLNNL